MAKVMEVDTIQVRKEDKVKDRPKKSKSKRHGRKRTSLKHAKDKPKRSKSKKPGGKRTGLKHTIPQPLDPNGRVEGGVPVREATINESPEHSQIGRKRKHKSIYRSQPWKVSHSDLVKIASYVRSAHDASGRTAKTAYAKHLRKSIDSGISAAFDDVQSTRTSQPEQFVKQKLRDNLLKWITSESPYTPIRRVLVTLDNFIEALKVQVTATQQSAANQVEHSPGEDQEEWEVNDQNHGFEPSHVHGTRPQDSRVQWHKNTTFSRDFILIIWRRSVLVHLRAMDEEDFLSIVNSAFQTVSPHANPSRALRWLSHATITDSGNVKVSMHTKDAKELDTLTEDMITEWASILQDEAEQSSRVFEVLVPNFPADLKDLADSDRKAEIIERLVRNNASKIPSLTRPDDIYDIQPAKSDGKANSGIAIVLVFNSCQLANSVIENGLDWNGEHHRCEALGASELLERCERCQLYTHTANSCTNTVRCGKCAEPHSTRSCKSIDFTCAVCSGPHPACSEACPARNAARDKIRRVRFAPDSEEDYPQLFTSYTHHEKDLRPTSSHSHSKEVLEKIRRLRQEAMTLEEGLIFGLESRDQCSVSTAVPRKKLESRSTGSGEVQQAAAIAGLPAASDGKHESRKRKAKESTPDNVQSDTTFDSKRVKREDSAFGQFRYQRTHVYY